MEDKALTRVENTALRRPRPEFVATRLTRVPPHARPIPKTGISSASRAADKAKCAMPVDVSVS